MIRRWWTDHGTPRCPPACWRRQLEGVESGNAFGSAEGQRLFPVYESPHEDLEAVESAEGTCYRPDPVTQFLDQVRDLAEGHSLDELTTELRDIGDEIDRRRREYDVDDVAELRGTVGDDELSGEDRRERLEVIEEWEYDVEMREAIRLAISLKGSLTELGADAGSGPAPERPPQEG